MGASSAIVTFQRSPRNGGATGPRTSAKEKFIATAKVCTRPISSEATKAPVSEPRPPTTMTTNRIGPSERGHVGLRDQRGTGDHAREARERRARAEHEHEYL